MRTLIETVARERRTNDEQAEVVREALLSRYYSD